MSDTSGNFVLVQTNKEIKLCPFCGSAGELNSYERGEYASKLVCCSNDECPLDLPPEGFYASTKKEALEIWNKRSSVNSESTTSIDKGSK